MLTDPVGERVVKVVEGRTEEAADGLLADGPQPVQWAAFEPETIGMSPAYSPAVLPACLSRPFFTIRFTWSVTRTGP